MYQSATLSALRILVTGLFLLLPALVIYTVQAHLRERPGLLSTFTKSSLGTTKIGG